MIKRVMLIALCFALVAALALTGCAPARRPYDNRNTTTGYGTNTGAGANPGTTGYGPGYQTGYGARYGTGYGTGNYNNISYDTMKSDQIATAVKQIQGVQTATVVVTGNTAYVGVVLAPNTTADNTNNIKNQVAQMVRSTATGVNTVYVSTDAGFMNRLRAVGEGLRSGRPITGFTTELNNMIRGLSPTRW